MLNGCLESCSRGECAHLLILPEHLCSSRLFSGVLVAMFLVFCVVLRVPFFVFLLFYHSIVSGSLIYGFTANNYTI